jgi:hypothetical protein
MLPFMATQAPPYHASRLHRVARSSAPKGMETLTGKQGGTPPWRANVIDRADLNIPYRKQAAGTATAHSLHGQDQGTPD